MSSVLQAGLLPVEHSINALLRQDPASLLALAPLQGRLVALQLTELPFVIGIRLFDDGISLSGAADQADGGLHGSISDFLQLASSANKASALINSRIQLSGDTELVLALARIADRLDIDWEAFVSPVTGGLLAHQLGKGVRSLLRWGQDTARTNRMAVSDYLQDEARVIVHRQELEQFASSVDQLRLDSDRLEAKLQQLAQQRQQQRTKD
jgi:ubiquinone biosynthesis protein UbiJ